MCKKERSAYLTMEASLVIPIILGGIIFILYIGFYLYNFAIINQVAYIAALRGSQMKQASSSQVKNYVEEQVDELLSHQILAREDIEKEVNVSAGKIKVKIYTSMNPLFAKLMPLQEENWEISGEAQVSRVKPIEIIRGVRKINGH